MLRRMARIPALPPPPLLAADNALFLDVDGTLAPFAPTPGEVTIAPAVLQDLALLHQRLNGALALLSGRPMEQLDRLFSPLALTAGALHGHHWRHAGHQGQGNLPPEASRRWLHRHARRLARLLPGLEVESKHDGLALHWRNAPALGAEVNRCIACHKVQIAARLPGYRLQPGDHVLEFVPQGSDKGTALRHLMTLPPFTGRRPVHIGDDLTDEHAFAAANALGGSSVLVGNRTPSLARHQLPSPSHLHAWLHRVARTPFEGVTP